MTKEQHTAHTVTPEAIAAALGKSAPTPEQAAVIEAPAGPMLVTAGAGAGKTDTMANRVVYLVANGLVKPDQVLGLTFTRKAAQNLSQRIRRNLIDLRDSGSIALKPEVRESLQNIAPKAMTYDAFVGELVREFGLLAPAEPFARMITDAELYAIAHQVVTDYTGALSIDKQVGTVTEEILALRDNMSNNLRAARSVVECSQEFIRAAEELPQETKKTAFPKELEKKLDAQRHRMDYLPLVEELTKQLREQRVTTFGEQMAVAAKLVAEHPVVGQEMLNRYRVVMLDEYQDTSHAQRIFLRDLFGKGQKAPDAAEDAPAVTVTAVGDPMQSIYRWRGASEANLASFTHDFPQASGEPAPKKELTVAWRNPRLVLEMANVVADVVLAGGVEAVEAAEAGEVSDAKALGRRATGGESTRLVGPLRPRDDAPSGDIKLGYFSTPEEECSFVAEHMKEKYQAAQAAGTPLSAAVLVRRNDDSVEVAHYLEEAGVPYEIVGLGGLLSQPEIQDLLAIATMLIRPQDTSKALRVLSGPMCGIGLRDMEALRHRAKNLRGRGLDTSEETSGAEEVAPSDDAPADDSMLGWLREKIAQVTPEKPEQAVGLTDAVADLGERDRYTPEGLARLEELSSKLRALRKYSLSKPLLDLFADIERAFNVRTEALARDGRTGTAHLDRFADIVSTFSGSGLAAWLDYCEMAAERENGLEPGEVPAADDRVLIMTTHKAKGLEWEHVSVLHADSQTYTGKAKSYVAKATELPGEDDAINADDFPNKKGDVTRKSFNDAADAKKRESAELNQLEADRLFYVAMTRTETSLTITGSGTNKGQGKRKKGPYVFLERLAEKFPDTVVGWNVPDTVEETDGTELAVGTFPYLAPDTATVAAADNVRAAMDDLPAAVDGERFAQWETEASALIEEHRGLMAPQIDVALPTELTASDVVALRGDPVQFAKRQRRPVPFKPNAYAKRGTAFHAWLEEYFGSTALLTEEELPGIDEELTLEELDELKDNFRRSAWAARTPEEVEAPFEITIGGAVVRGRMDAVFKDADGTWIVVDWKTGRPPRGDAMRAAEQQLAVYREAWRRIRLRAGENDPQVRAIFHYITDNYDFEPRHLGGAEELAEILRKAAEPVEY